MNKIFLTVKHAIQSVRREYWSIIAEMYSLCIIRSRPITAGCYTMYIETYCETILHKCKSLAIDIPASSAQKPRRLERLFMTWRFGLPSWPIRLSLYKGQRLEQVETSPNEIANALQRLYNVSIRQGRQNRTSIGKFDGEVESIPAIQVRHKKDTDILTNNRPRETFPRQEKTPPLYQRKRTDAGILPKSRRSNT